MHANSFFVDEQSTSLVGSRALQRTQGSTKKVHYIISFILVHQMKSYPLAPFELKRSVDKIAISKSTQYLIILKFC